MVLFVGQIETRMREREAFQEVDYRAAFGPLAKWATEIESADRVAEIVARAFAVARSGRPGPVVVALPEDVLTATTDGGAGPAVGCRWRRPRPPTSTGAMALLGAAERPLLIVGGVGWGAARRATALRAFAEANRLPVVVRLPLPGPPRQRQPELCRRRRARQDAGGAARCSARRT